jgi:hypothetical protein
VVTSPSEFARLGWQRKPVFVRYYRGGFNGMGGSSARAIVGVTNAAQVQKNPTTTTMVLNARFIVYSPCADSLGAETLTGEEL